jgi:pimeloyl-ACP methyl ester carboxylesterase
MTTSLSGLGFGDLSYPVEIEHLRIDGLDIAMCDRGAGAPAILLLHGLGSYLPVWSRNLHALSRHHRVVAIDLPGYGKSTKTGVALSMEGFARLVDRVIDALGLARVVLVGHSMGGQIALTHALMRPGRAEALVLVAPAGFERFSDGERRWLEELTSAEAILAAPAQVVRQNLMTCFHRLPDEVRFMVEDRLAVIGGPDYEDFARALSSSVRAMLDGPVFARLPQIAVPVLVLFGAEDRLIPNPVLHPGLAISDIAKLGAEQLRYGQLTLIPQAGHMVQLERPDEVSQAILAFLEKQLFRGSDDN